MGAQFSALGRDIQDLLPNGSDQILHALHVVGHYGLIPAIYVYALVQAGEFSMNPFNMLEKVLIA